MSNNTTFQIRASDLSTDCASLKTFKVVSGVVICITGFFMNSSILITLARKSKLSVVNTLVFHLATSDLFVFLTNGPYLLLSYINHSLAFSPLLCQTAAFLGRFTTVVSMYLLTVMSASRFYSLVSPFEYRARVTPSKTNRVCIGAWILSFSLSLTPILGWGEYSVINGQCWCALDPSKYMSNWFAHLMLAFVIPLALNSWLFARTLKLINGRRISNGKIIDHHRGPLDKKTCKGKLEHSSSNRGETGVEDGSTTQNMDKHDEEGAGGIETDLEFTVGTSKDDKTDEKGVVNCGFEGKKETAVSVSNVSSTRNPGKTSCSNDNQSPCENSIQNNTQAQGFEKPNKVREKRSNTVIAPKLLESKYEFRINAIISLLFICYVIGCGPTYVVWTWFALYPKSVPRTAFVVFRFFVGSHSLINPFIYGIINSEIRSDVWALWSRLVCFIKQ